MGKIVAVANQKGGVGKTTTVVNLAAALTFYGKKILVVDCDPQGNATSGLGMSLDHLNLYEVMANKTPIKEAIKKTSLEQLYCITAHPDLAGVEIELADIPDRQNYLKIHILTVRPYYDFVFLDCPPSLGLLTLNALNAADTVLIPVQCEYYALEGLARLLKTIKMVKQYFNPFLKIEGFLLTMFDQRNLLSHQIEKEVRKHFKDYTFHTVINRNVRLSEAPSYGLPIFLYDAKCKGAQQYRQLAEEILRKQEEKYDQERIRQGA